MTMIIPMTAPIIPVILCGGSGTRLWPLSRGSYPKQFGRLIGETSLFHVLGFGGLFVGSVLLFRVVAAVARDGTT